MLRGRSYCDYEIVLNTEKAEEIKRVLELYLADARNPGTGSDS
jgi:hypothetical protein